MTTRSVGVLIVLITVLAGLALGIRWLTSGGTPIPAPSAGQGQASLTPWRPGLPRYDLTPGAINAIATQDNLEQTVCRTGWAASVRPPSAYTSALKVAQIIEYGYADHDPRHYQEDHLVPLELGGASRDRRNLWPEPNTIELPDGTSIGSKEKDDLEDALHAQVCSGTIRLADAQLAIERDWIAAWQAAGRP